MVINGIVTVLECLSLPEGSSISAKDSHRDLGLHLESNLRLVHHYDYICSKVYKILGLLRRTFVSTNSPFVKKKLFVSQLTVVKLGDHTLLRISGS